MTTTTYTENHNTFGGIIYAEDFNTSENNYSMADRIIASMKFDEQCRKNADFRDRARKGTN